MTYLHNFFAIISFIVLLLFISIGNQSPSKASENTKQVSNMIEAAESGNVDAQLNLGIAYAKGNGVKKDLKKAVYWLERSSKGNSARGTYLLARAYELGRGVKKDPRKAFEFMSRAEAMGIEVAKVNLGLYFRTGLGVKKDLLRSFQIFEELAESGHPVGMFILGLNYEKGLGVTQDLDIARIWYQKAAKKGYKEGAKGLARIAKKLKGTSSLPPPGEQQSYKGITLIGSSYSDVSNKSFFKQLKMAIDMTEQLPEDLREKIWFIKKIIYDPPSKHRMKNTAFTNVPGVYTIGKDFDEPAPLIIYKDAKYAAPISFALNLVSSGLMAEEHMQAIKYRSEISKLEGETSTNAIQQRDKAKKALARIMSGIQKTDREIAKESNCKSSRAIFKASKAFGLPSKDLDDLSKSITKKGCWS